MESRKKWKMNHKDKVAAYGKEYGKRYREEHRDEIAEKKREYMKSYYQRKKEEIKAKTNAYYHANHEKCKERNKQYRDTHKEERKKYVEANKEKKKQAQIEYYKIPINRAKNLLRCYKRMDRDRGFGDVCDFDGAWIVENIFAQHCAHCGETDWLKIGCNRLDNTKGHTKDNVEPCCRSCNAKLTPRPWATNKGEQ